MPIINMHLISGRTAEQKRRVMSAVAHAAAGALNVGLDTVRVLITEHSADEFSVAGVSVAERSERNEPPQRSSGG